MSLCVKCKCKEANPKRKTCDECYQSRKQELEMIKFMQIKHLKIKYKDSEKINTKIRQFNRSWNKQLLGYPCQVCNYNIYIELAHIKPIANFSDESYLCEINNPNNILVLCPNHHKEFDFGFLLLEDIPMRETFINSNAFNKQQQEEEFLTDDEFVSFEDNQT